MNEEEKNAYITYRLEKAAQTYEAAELLVQHQQWNSAVNRFYYAAYYAVTALLAQQQMDTKTHAGVKTLFFLNFIKNGKIEMSLGKLYADLFDWRQKGDYADFFDFTQNDVLPLLLPTKQLISAIIQQIKTV
jgi:uncharacterized protein (UPF0332 family)